MLHRAGNVDGEGDGCGLLLDIPRKIWAEEVRSGGHDPSLALDDAFAVAHIFVERSQDLEKIQHDARELLGRGRLPHPRRAGRRRRLGRARPDRARGGAALLAARRPRPRRRRRRDRDPLRPDDRARAEARRPRPLLLGDDLRLQGDGRARRCSAPTTPTSATSASRRSAASATTATRPTPGPRSSACSRSRVLGHNGEINTIEQLRQEARMLGVPIQPGSSDSQDLNRTIETLVSRDGLSASPRRWRWSCRRSSTRSAACPRSCTPSTCTCARRWARSPRARSR